MEKLIDAEGLAIDLIHSMDYCDDILEIVERQPEAIVRCKDCIHLSNDRIAPERHRICRKYGVGKPDDGFCDEGERKEVEDEI